MNELLEFLPHDWIISHPRMPRPIAVEGILRVGDLVLITGSWDTFKSTLGLELAWSLSTGRPWLGRFPVLRQMRMGILQVEIDPGSYDERCKRFPPARELMVASCIGFTFDQMDKLVEATSDAALEGVVLDPLGQLWPSFSLNGEPFQENLKNHVSPIMRELKKFRMTTVMIHHDPKPSEYKTRASGSSALLNDPDVRIFIDRNKDDSIQVTVRNRLQRPTKPFRAVFDEERGRLRAAAETPTKTVTVSAPARLEAKKRLDSTLRARLKR